MIIMIILMLVVISMLISALIRLLKLIIMIMGCTRCRGHTERPCPQQMWFDKFDRFELQWISSVVCVVSKCLYFVTQMYCFEYDCCGWGLCVAPNSFMQSFWIIMQAPRSISLNTQTQSSDFGRALLYRHFLAGAYLFPQSVKLHYFCSGPISVDPICPQPSVLPTVSCAASQAQRGAQEERVNKKKKKGSYDYIMCRYIYIYIYIERER